MWKRRTVCSGTSSMNSNVSEHTPTFCYAPASVHVRAKHESVAQLREHFAEWGGRCCFRNTEPSFALQCHRHPTRWPCLFVVSFRFTPSFRHSIYSECSVCNTSFDLRFFCACVWSDYSHGALTWMTASPPPPCGRMLTIDHFIGDIQAAGELSLSSTEASKKIFFSSLITYFK